VAKFDFSLSKLRKRYFCVKNIIGKCQISKSREALALRPLPKHMTHTPQFWLSVALL